MSSVWGIWMLHIIECICIIFNHIYDITEHICIYKLGYMTYMNFIRSIAWAAARIKSYRIRVFYQRSTIHAVVPLEVLAEWKQAAIARARNDGPRSSDRVQSVRGELGAGMSSIVHRELSASWASLENHSSLG